MSSRIETAVRWTLGLAVALIPLTLFPDSAAAQTAPPQGNVVQINVVNGALKMTNRGVGLCKRAAEDCPNQMIWKWIGADPNESETEKIVISYIKGTNEAYNCFQDSSGSPKLTFEILERQTEAVATVSEACPDKSAWLYQISCIRTDAGSEGELCTGIAPIDPGAVIGDS